MAGDSTETIKKEGQVITLPDSPFYEEDMMKFQDISLPQTLCTSDYIIQKSTIPFQNPKYSIGEVVIFVDPHTNMDSHGLIVSNVTIGRGYDATPPLLRGEASIISYEVNIQGPISNMRQCLISLLQQQDLRNVIQNVPRNVENITNITSRQYLYLAIEVNKKAALGRHLRDHIDTNMDSLNIGDVDKSRMIVFNETEIMSPQEKWDILELQRKDKYLSILRSITHHLHQRVLTWGFNIWIYQAQSITHGLLLKSSTILQSFARVILSRKILERLKQKSSELLLGKWKLVHSMFEYSVASDLSAVTMDNKHYFVTLCGANKYFTFLRKMCTRLILHLRRKILDIYRKAWLHWRCLYLKGIAEDAKLLCHHIESQQSLRDNDTLEGPGRWHPSVGLMLPPLKTLYMPRTAEERLFMDKSRRLDHCAFRAYSEGPTDWSCWVIPGTLIVVS
jgi:hypothetical protein